MGYQTMTIDVLELCHEWFGYTYHCDGDRQDYFANMDQQEGQQ